MAKKPVAARDILTKSKAYRSAGTVSGAVAKLIAKGHSLSDVNLFAPANGNNLEPYVSLRSTASNRKLTLPCHGIVITSKLAKALNVTTGDTLKVATTNGQSKQFTIKGIAKNYVDPFCYLSNTAYQNSLLVIVRNQTPC